MKISRGVKIILAGLIDDAEVVTSRGRGVGQNLIKRSDFQVVSIAGVVETSGKMQL